MFSQMTVQEKLDIQSTKFDLLWHRVFNELPASLPEQPPALYDPHMLLDAARIDQLKSPLRHYMQCTAAIGFDNNVASRVEAYDRRRRIFENNWCASPQRHAHLRRYLAEATHSPLRWEVPKGGIIAGETTLACAHREFQQETLFTDPDYVIVAEPFDVAHDDDNTTWHASYYTAMTKRADVPSIDMTGHQPQEIDDVRWMTLREVSRTGNAQLERVAALAFDNVMDAVRRSRRSSSSSEGEP
jgi:8-oxo-dGTP pyrophosphatase MutT (NUDIX family)